jgi:uridylate kinase
LHTGFLDYYQEDDMGDRRRILLKLSGEALAGDNHDHKGFAEAAVRAVAGQVRRASEEGVQIAIVIGGGNFWRGRQGTEIDRVKADQIGMLATVMNCLYVAAVFETEGMTTSVYTAFPIDGMTKVFNRDEAVADLEAGRIVFFGGGTGHPYFSTDTGVVLRALEMEADEILLAKAVDGVYDKDPKKYPDAKKFDTISLKEVVDRRLQVIDLAASVICMENHMPLAVFDLNLEDGIYNATKGVITGTKVTV